MSRSDAIIAMAEEDLRAYIGVNADSYALYLSKVQQRQNVSTLSWSWLAFFVPPAWLAYRRLWLELLVLVIVATALNLLQAYSDAIDFGSSVGVAMSLVIAMLGKSFVLQKAQKAVARADAKDLSGSERANFLASQGGVSTLPACLISIAYLGFIGLIILGLFVPT